MQLVFLDEKVQKIMCNASMLQRKIGLEFGKKTKQRLNQLEASENFNQYLTKICLGKPHPLKGNLDKYYSISITANYRLIVEPMNSKLDMESLKECKMLNIKGVLEYHVGKNEWIIP